MSFDFSPYSPPWYASNMTHIISVGSAVVSAISAFIASRRARKAEQEKTQFIQLHSDRAAAILKVHEALRKLRDATKSVTVDYDLSAPYFKEEDYDHFKETLNEYGLYFPKSLADSMNNLLSQLSFSFLTREAISVAPIEDLKEQWKFRFRVEKRRINKGICEIEEEFRALLGVKDKSWIVKEARAIYDYITDKNKPIEQLYVSVRRNPS